MKFVIVLLLLLSGCSTISDVGKYGYKDTIEVVDTENKEKVGVIEQEIFFWHPLFMADVMGQKEEFERLLVDKAKKEYCDCLSVTITGYEVEWHPFSMLFYFSTLGWVEKAKAYAVVYRTK